MESDILFDQVLTAFQDLMDHRRFQVVRKERAGEFDFRLMILDSPLLKIRFTLEKGLVTLAIGTLDAPNDWSWDGWFDLDILLEYLARQRTPRSSSIINRMMAWIAGSHHRGRQTRSMIYVTVDHATNVSQQLQTLKGKLVGSYEQIENLLRKSEQGQITSELQIRRDKCSEDFLNQLLRNRNV
ncbi:MAG: hypothetical protein M1546_18635 [Chloroflexi bacterium]|nr:hypothetical protein [Chloroflexota bacterium]